MKNGDLKITADNYTRQYIKDNKAVGYWNIMSELFENYACNGSFQHFDASDADPFVGLTSAPCIAESISPGDDGYNEVDGRLWTFNDHATRDDLEELKNKGYVIYSLVK